MGRYVVEQSTSSSRSLKAIANSEVSSQTTSERFNWLRNWSKITNAETNFSSGDQLQGHLAR